MLSPEAVGSLEVIESGFGLEGTCLIPDSTKNLSIERDTCAHKIYSYETSVVGQ